MIRSRSPTRSSRAAEAEGDVFGDRQRLEQREVLEHHADAQALRMAGVLDGDLLALPDDLALVGLDHAVDDFHQRALAGAVFAQQRMDLIALDRQRNVVVGEAAGILLGHAGHCQQRAAVSDRSWRTRDLRCDRSAMPCPCTARASVAQLSLPSTPWTSHCIALTARRRPSSCRPGP